MPPTFEELVFRADTASTLDVVLASAPQGELLVVGVGQNTGVLDPTISGSGWTEFVNQTHGVAARLKAWWKVAGASEPTTITFTHGAGVEAIGFAARYSGMHATAPAVNDVSAVGTDNQPSPGAAGGSGSDLLFSAYYYTQGGIALIDPSGYSELGTESSTNSTLTVLEKLSDSSADPIFTSDSGGDDWLAFNSGWDAAVGTLLFRRRRLEMA